METTHLAADRKDHPEKKRMKLDKIGHELTLSQPSIMSNGIGSEAEILKKDERSRSERNDLKPASESTQSLKRPATDLSDTDDIPLASRSKLESSTSIVKKIKKIKHDGNSSSGSPKQNKLKDIEAIKKIKTEKQLSMPSKSESAKGIKCEVVLSKNDFKSKLNSTKVDGVKKLKSDSPKTEGIKKLKSEPGLATASPSKSMEIKTSKGDSGIKRIKLDGELSSKAKSDSSSKSPVVKKDGLISPKAESIKKEKHSSLNKNKERSSSKSEKPKTTSSDDGVKKEKHKSSSSKSEGVFKSGPSKSSKDSSVLTSAKTEGVKKEQIKGGSSMVEDVKKTPEKKQRPSSGEVVKKIKSEKASVGSPEKKFQVSSGEDKTVFSDTSSSPEKKAKISPGETVKKIKTEGSISPEKKAKVSSGEAVKKLKSDGGIAAKISQEPNEKNASETKGREPSSKELSGKKSSCKTTADDSSDDDVPLASRAKSKASMEKMSETKQRKRKGQDDDDDDDYKPLKKVKKKAEDADKEAKKDKKKSKVKEKSKKEKGGVKEGKVKEEKKDKEKKQEEVWKWWEEEKHPEGVKWLTLEHKGPYFPPEYEPLPDTVNFYYDGEKVKLSSKTEEVAGFYAKMLDHDYTSKKIFNDNFFQDWRNEMTAEERSLIKHLAKCDFKEIHAYYVQKNEERKSMTKEEKLVIKEKNEAILEEYGYCLMDGHKERVGNFKIEPPGLFRGRGDHPKQGKLKKRLKAKDVIINIGKHTKVPDPPVGQKWKAIQHDNKVTWLACWIENIQGSYKYVMLNPTSRIKGEKDWQKYETARKLKSHIDKIRNDYTNDWKSKEMRIRQRGVALYFIDKLALRAGHEKDEDTADTVGCCSLRYEHLKLHKQHEGKDYVAEFDFLGKDSIHYHNLVQVEKRVFKNLELFKHGKSEGDDLFDRLTTQSLNKYLSELMEGLSAKVFRTYNASMTLQDQLNKLEVENNVAAKVLGYNRANRAVAILCNHQRSAPKTFEQSMSNLQQKIDVKKKAIKDGKNELKDLKHEAKGGQSVTLTRKIDKKKTAIERLKEQLFKLEVSQTDKHENKEIALGTSKLNYLDPRISIAWCLKNDVPIEKIYNKTQRQKFAWAIDMTEKDFVF